MQDEAGIEVFPKDSKEPKNQRNQCYTMRCANCGTSTDICMIDYRDKEGNLIGWLFSCDSCRKTVSNF